MVFSTYFLFFNAEREFVILFSYLKEPQLIVANLTPGSSPLESLAQKPLKGTYRKRGRQSYAHILPASIFTKLELTDRNYSVGEESKNCFQLLMLVKTQAFHSVS